MKNYETDKLPDKYTTDMAEKNGDIVVKGQSQINYDKFTRFIENINKKTKDRVRITAFTTEGGSIIYDLIYYGQTILLIVGTTRDGFSSRDIREYKVSKGKKLYVLREDT